MDLAHCTLTLDFTFFYVCWRRHELLHDTQLRGMRLILVSFEFVFFPGVFLSPRATGACPLTTDLIMRVNVRTITTTIPEMLKSYVLSWYTTRVWSDKV